MSVVIQTGFLGIGPDLNHPRIGWQRHGNTITSTGTDAAGFPAENAGTPLTYTAWQSTTADQYWRNTFAASRTVSYVGIAAHNGADVGATFVIQKLVGGVWENWQTNTQATPTNNDAIFFLLEPTVVDGIAIRSRDAAARIGVIQAGLIMEWPRKATWTGLPITDSRQFRYNINPSDTGNWLGRSVISSGLEFSMQVDHLSETFRRGDFADFAKSANTGDGTFFIAPRPLDYPNEVAYAWSTETVRMSRSLPNKAISGSVSLNMQGYRAP